MFKIARTVNDKDGTEVELEVTFTQEGTTITATNQETGEVRSLELSPEEGLELYDLMHLARPAYKTE